MGKLFQDHSVHNNLLPSHKHLASVRNTGDIEEHTGLTLCFSCFTQGHPWDASCQARKNPKPSQGGVKSPEMTQKLVQSAGSPSSWQGAQWEVRGHGATGSCLPSPWRIPGPFQLLRKAATAAVTSYRDELPTAIFKLLSRWPEESINSVILYWNHVSAECITMEISMHTIQAWM